MNEDSLKLIKEICEDFKKEYLQCVQALENHKSKIAELDAFLDTLLNEEETELQVFFPKKVRDAYQDTIADKKKQRNTLISEMDSLEKQRIVLKNRVDCLEQIINEDFLGLFEKQFSVLDIQEKERQRIARDLHDTSLQNLSYLIHKTELVSLYIDKDPVKAKLELATVEKGIRKTIDEIRNYILNIRPIIFDDFGLKDTLEKIFPVLNHDNKFIIQTDIDDIVYKEKDASMEIFIIAIYRIIQECVNNAISHSNGTEIFVSLKDVGNQYNIIVKDNGDGFDLQDVSSKEKHFGLSVIKERVILLNGKIQVDTQNGTSINIEIPKLL